MRVLITGLAIVATAFARTSFTKDVAPILYKNCVSCHRPGEMAPMSLLDYQSARPWAKAIQTAVVTKKCRLGLLIRAMAILKTMFV